MLAWILGVYRNVTANIAGVPVSPLRGSALGLAQQVKAVDELVIRAVSEGSGALAVQAIALHPLVDSVTVARQLLAGYHRALPDFYARFR